MKNRIIRVVVRFFNIIAINKITPTTRTRPVIHSFDNPFHTFKMGVHTFLILTPSVSP
ncbi:MAG: hypothetical protein JNL70_04950 [Saprospiraceae bacterium]|nr:hypothetical protein [Saprospiraceae bacterium]